MSKNPAWVYDSAYWQGLKDVIAKWAACLCDMRPPMRNCLCKSCRKWGRS